METVAQVAQEEVMEQEATPTPEEPQPKEVEEKDPTEKLKTVLEQKLELEGIEKRMREQRLLIQAEEDALRFKLASNLVDGLFVSLAEFAKEFTEGEVFKQYGRIQHHIEKIKEHDPTFPRSLAENKYSVEVGREDILFWLNMCQKFIAIGEPLDKFLRGVFGTKVHGTPFEPKT